MLFSLNLERFLNPCGGDGNLCDAHLPPEVEEDYKTMSRNFKISDYKTTYLKEDRRRGMIQILCHHSYRTSCCCSYSVLKCCESTTKGLSFHCLLCRVKCVEKKSFYFVQNLYICSTKSSMRTGQAPERNKNHKMNQNRNRLHTCFWGKI